MYKIYSSNVEALKGVINNEEWQYGNYHTLANHNVIITSSFKKDNIPLNPYRHTPWKTAIREFLGYLRGYTTLEEFHSIGCHTWDHNAVNPTWLSNPACKGEGDLGRIYGAQARDWKKPDGTSIDQLKTLIDSLKTHKDHRGNYLTFWNPGEFDIACLRPCMHSHQFVINNQGMLCLTSYSRSMDGPLGGDANVIQNWFYLYALSELTGLPFGGAGIFVSNYHLYTNQIDSVTKMLSSEPAEPCKMEWVGPPLTFEMLMEEDVTKYIKIVGNPNTTVINHPFTTTSSVSNKGS